MPIAAILFALYIVSKLKNDYYFYQLKNTRNWFITFFIVFGLTFPFWWLMLIMHLVFRNNGTMDDTRKRNMEKEQGANTRQYFSSEDIRRSEQLRAEAMRRRYEQQRSMHMNRQENFNRAMQMRQAYEQRFTQQPTQYSYTAPPLDSSLSYNLPKTQRAREKIIRKFNDRYSLNLDKDDIRTIASASYFSVEWAAEISAMTRKYNSYYEWLGNGRPWLRAYISAFSNVEVVSVFSKQESYVFEAYDRIFSDICCDDNLPVEVVIENINHKYLTNFNEATFMQAMSYMESRGKTYRYGSPLLNNINYDLERLAQKYDNTNGQTGQTPMQ